MSSRLTTIRRAGRPTIPSSGPDSFGQPLVHEGIHLQIDVIESGYEFLLAYAAQGRETDREGDRVSEVRGTLTGMGEAATNIARMLAGENHEFAAIVAEDARKSGAAISLVLAQDRISSELVDNLNASIHLRALLTDLFLLSEASL